MGTPCYIIGVPKQIHRQIGKSFGDIVEVVLKQRDCGECNKKNDRELIEMCFKAMSSETWEALYG